ncbi:MAG: S8 family serine peptidase [Chloroflexi bacterium]|nr:S8 family serine peptidase [Chloroflexota bacterium]
MRKRTLAILAACAAVLAAAPGTGGVEAAPPTAPESYVVVQYGVATGVSAARAGASLGELGYRSVPVPAGESREHFLARLRSMPGVLSAEADAEVFAAETPDDPFYAGSQSPYLAAIGAPAAWDLHGGSNTVVVAVLDSGIDLNHPDLAGRLWVNTGEVPGNGIDDDGNGCTDDVNGCRFINLTADRQSGCGYTYSSVPGSARGEVQDDNGGSNHSHGTIVSGIIGAAGSNGVGISGVAWDVRLMPVKVLDCGTPSHLGQPSGDMANVAHGIDYARRMGADVINLSLASSPPHQQADIQVLRDAIQAAEAEGIIIVCAAGNFGTNPTQPGPGYPAAYTQYENIIAVGAADNLAGYTWANYSSYGPALDFAAPGSNIVGTLRSDLGLAQPYGSEPKGTSFAAPLAAGMFALMKSRNSGLTAADYIAIARAAATPPALAPHGGNWAGSGIINVGAALQRLPLTVTGSALHDWKDELGAEVRAVVEGNACGSVTASAGLLATFSLPVKPAAEVAGCGSPGKNVQVYVANRPATPLVQWPGRNKDLNQPAQDYSSVSPPPGTVVVQVYGSTWSNVGHLEATGEIPGALGYLPNPWSETYAWDPVLPGADSPGAYRRYLKEAPAYVNNWSYVAAYQAYWVKAPAASLGVLNPNPPLGRTVTFQPGWNNFVYTGTNRSVVDALSGIVGQYSAVLRYDNSASRWLTYAAGAPRYLNDFGALLKLQVYWVYVTAPGPVAVTMN